VVEVRGFLGRRVTGEEGMGKPKTPIFPKITAVLTTCKEEGA